MRLILSIIRNVGTLEFLYSIIFKNPVISKEQVQGMWERFSTAKLNAAAESRFR